jgi:hypothetical protein
MKPKVYVETTVISYLVARPSRDVVTAGLILATRDWWERRRRHYALFASATVVQEAQAGDPDMARLRLAALRELGIYDVDEATESLGRLLRRRMNLPDKASEDALHVASAAVHAMDFLITWNCRHINNAAIIPRIEKACAAAGYRCPRIYTPTELP